MAVTLKVFSGSTEKGNYTLSTHEAKAIQRNLAGETPDEKLADLVAQLMGRFNIVRSPGSTLCDYHQERTGWTNEDVRNKGFDALEVAPDKGE